jgi:hypothetical protein
MKEKKNKQSFDFSLNPQINGELLMEFVTMLEVMSSFC